MHYDVCVRQAASIRTEQGNLSHCSGVNICVWLCDDKEAWVVRFRDMVFRDE
jgi:hypothetical protein